MVSWRIFILGIFIVEMNERVLATKLPTNLLVAFSMRKPFAYRGKTGALEGMDFMIIENFARRLNAEVKYTEFNTSFNEMLRRGEIFQRNLK